MVFNQKNFRYAYWIVVAFTKKNAKLILLSFLLSIITVISIITIAPYLLNFLAVKKQVIGLVGTYDVANVPEEIQNKISNGLVFVNDKGEIIPVIADTWEMTNKGLEYRFHIRKNLYWNNGDKFTVKDINYNFKDVTVEKQGDYLIIFRLKKTLPTFPTYLTQSIIKYPLNGVAGLYRVERSKIDYGNIKEIDLTPNKPDLPVLIYKFYDSETKLINAYKLGEITEMTLNRKSTVDLFSTWKNTEIIKSVDYTRLMTLFFNMNKDILKEKDMRQAVAMSIDTDLLNKLGQPAIGPIPPISWAYNPNIKIQPYNPDVAEKLFKKYQTGTESASLNIDTYYEYLDVSDDIQDNLSKAGLKVNVNVLSDNQPGNYDILLAYWKVPLDPDQYYFWHSTQTQGNITHYKNPRIDLLLEQGRNTLSIDERKTIYYTFQRTMADDVPADFLYYPYIYTIRRK